MPPASPVPGWSSGEVCRLIIATRPSDWSNVHLRKRVLVVEPRSSLPHSRTVRTVAGLSARALRACEPRCVRRGAASGRAGRRLRPTIETSDDQAPKTPSTISVSATGRNTSRSDQTRAGKAMPTIDPQPHRAPADQAGTEADHGHCQQGQSGPVEGVEEAGTAGLDQVRAPAGGPAETPRPLRTPGPRRADSWPRSHLAECSGRQVSLPPPAGDEPRACRIET